MLPTTPVCIHGDGWNIGAGFPCFIVAEAGVNHNGSLERALEMVEVAIAAGADAVKFQTFRAEALVTPRAPKANYQIENGDQGESQQAMLRRLELSVDAHKALLAHCRSKGIVFLSTPFDESSADLLSELGVPMFKIASGELTNAPLLQRIAGYGKPMLVSTGMASLGEVETACRLIGSSGNPRLALLHCVSSYPARARDANLRAMETLRMAFGVPVGYSDHTIGCEVAFAAAALGACIIEKHFTLDRSLPGPDQKVSVEPAELATLVRGIRSIEEALGDGRKVPAPAEAEIAAVARKSLVAALDIPADTIIVRQMLAIKRPGTGLPPIMMDRVVGRRTRRLIAAGELVTLEALG